MARNTSFTCDRCAYTQKTDRKFDSSDRWLHTIVVYLLDGDDNRPTTYQSAKHEALWCEDCCIEVGLKQQKKPKVSTDPLPAPLTLEDLLREIIREEIAEQQP